MAAGIAMFPTIVPAALGVARTDWWKPLRIGLVGFGAAVAGFVVVRMEDLTLQRRLAALAMYAVLCAIEVLLLSRILAPSLESGSISHVPVAARVLLVGVPLLIVFALAIATIGISTG
jgi:phosphatidylserine synthase